MRRRTVGNGEVGDRRRGLARRPGDLDATRAALTGGCASELSCCIGTPDLTSARAGQSLGAGAREGENFFASDVSAIVAHTREAIYLKDYDIAALSRDKFEISSLLGGASGFEVSKVDFTEADVSRGEFAHYMLKEIFKQPATIEDAMRGRLSREEATAKLGGLDMTPNELRAIDRIILTGCGTACHAAMCGEYIIEALAHVPVEVEFASEFRYRNLPLPKDTLVFCISQSGETADTLAALRESQRKGLRTLGICNNVGSTIARESDGGVYMHAGVEIGVAATKSFTSQVTITTLIALLLGRIRHLSTSEGLRLIDELEEIPGKVTRILQLDGHIQSIARKYAHAAAMMFLGRQFTGPIALEGALKMKGSVRTPADIRARSSHGVIAITPSAEPLPDDSVLERTFQHRGSQSAQGPIIAPHGGMHSSKNRRRFHPDPFVPGLSQPAHRDPAPTPGLSHRGRARLRC